MAITVTEYNFNNKTIIQNVIQPADNNITLIAIDPIDMNLIGSTFFENILKAVRLEKDKNARIIEVDISKNEYINFEFSQISSSKLLLFGISPDKCGFNLFLKEFEAYETKESVIAFYPGLQSIERDVSLKKALWESLKTIYKIQ